MPKKRTKTMKINPKRPIEPLVGDNLGLVRHKLGNIHCMTNIREQLKLVRPKPMRSIPPALRRGWVLTVLETIAEYRSTYLAVTTGNMAYKCKVSRK